MVENGGKGGKDGNPFSFTNFLKGKQEVDSTPGRRSSTEDAENPYSFRKFLSQGKSSEGRHAYAHNPDLTARSSNSTASSSPKFCAQNANSSSFEKYSDFVQELPDFIQDHLDLKYEEDKTESNENLYESNEHFPHREYSREMYRNSGNLTDIRSSGSYENISASACQNDFTAESPSDLKNESYSGLPDFISGTSKSETEVTWSSSHLDESNGVSHSQSTLEDEIYKLREENAFLHKQLEQLTRTSDIQSSRIKELEKKLIELRESEAQETAALEKMVQQVELNLQVTTERAVLAEGQVAKLKQELKSLQALFKNVMKENDKLSCTSLDLESVTEKAQSLSTQLKFAADNAEQSLRTLLEGVNQLRLMSTLVASIGKIDEN